LKRTRADSLSTALQILTTRPLHPFINSFPLRLVKDTWVMTTKEVIYTSDKVIVGVSMFFFLLAVGVCYLTAARLFDHRVAVVSMALLLLCQTMWDFALSGLPQMLMLFLFSCAVYLIVRGIQAHYEQKGTMRWSAAIGALFGLLALSHALTIFLFAGALLFLGLFFRPRGRDALIMLAVFSMFYAPWMVRNHRVCGNPVGLGWYSGLADVRGSESQVMRTIALEGPLTDVKPRIYGEKLRLQIIRQFDSVYQLLGAIVVAPVFFVALLHYFKRPEVAMFRWCVLLMWLFAVFGIAVFGLGLETYPVNPRIDANNLHILLAPVMTFYGLAFVLMLWSRLEFPSALLRKGLITLIVLISAIPFISETIELLQEPKGRVRWPPYVAPFIAVLGQWTNEREITASDMPWAVAWYADRKSLWLPMSLNDFITLNDYNRLGGRVVGLYLTPITGHAGFINGVVKGEYKEWAPFIMRQVNIKDFPLRAVTAMPMENECVFYSDRDRWTTRED
jgi:4-amino-4-deoxy-L-arabinose transferase-like glycosyltransferase